MPCRASMKKYLLWFANEHIDFRLNEIRSIVKLFRINVNFIEESPREPWCIVELSGDEDAKKIASRSVSLRYVVELWSKTANLTELHASVKACAPHFLMPYCCNDLTFKIKVELFSNSQSQEEKIKKIESFDYLPIKGTVRLKNPDLTLQYIEYYGISPSPPPDEPMALFFGRWVADGQRDLINLLSLKKRKFIGNTSMDAQLSLLMANQALIKECDMVLDPFVGTGSLLVAAAQFGAYVIGTDIDYMTVHGKSRPTRVQSRKNPRSGESILSNLVQYGLESKYIDVLVADASLPLWRDNLCLNAIITDPPYGIREAVERIGTHGDVAPIDAKYLPTHIPSKTPYSMHRLMADLLALAAKHLVIGGRLVTWIPIIRNEYTDDCLPRHDCLKLVSNSEQVLSMASSRRLLTYMKTSHPKEESNNSSTEEKVEETFREKYYKQVEEHRKEKREKALQNPFYAEKILGNST